jgi:hypothetical protein
MVLFTGNVKLMMVIANALLRSKLVPVCHQEHTTAAVSADPTVSHTI